MFESIIIHICFIAVATILPNECSNITSKEIDAKLKEFGIIPEFLQYAPKYLAKVTYPPKKEVHFGSSLRDKEQKEKPEVHWPHNSSSYYSLVITDYDDNVNWDPLLKEYHMWFVCNIPGDNVTGGYEQVKYIAPEVVLKPHRMMVTVIEQANCIDLNVTDLIDPPRYYFSVMEVVYEYGGTIHAASLRQNNDKFLPPIYLFPCSSKPWKPDRLADLLDD